MSPDRLPLVAAPLTLAAGLLALASCDARRPSPGPPSASASAAARAPASLPSTSASSLAATPDRSSAPAATSATVAAATSLPAGAPAAASAGRAPRNPSIRDRGLALAAHLPTSVLGPGAPLAGPLAPDRDAPWIRRLTGDDLVSASFHGGGVSFTVVARFADGSRAMVKPAQSLVGSNHRAEIAAYHLDRLLGLGRVAPVAGRPLSLAWLRAQLAADERALARLSELQPDGDRVPAALIAWHDRPPVPSEPPAGWLDAMTSSSPATEPRLAWSDMVVFDALLDNTDRWSGGNVMTLGPAGPLIFLDNASALLPYRARQHAFLEHPLARVCLFRPSTTAALRAAVAPPGLAARLSASLAHDPLAPVLSPPVLAALDERAARVLGHLGRCQGQVLR